MEGWIALGQRERSGDGDLHRSRSFVAAVSENGSIWVFFWLAMQHCVIAMTEFADRFLFLPLRSLLPANT